MIRWPSARSLLDYRAMKVDHRPVRVENSKKLELKDMPERRVLQELYTTLNGLLTEWDLSPCHSTQFCIPCWSPRAALLWLGILGKFSCAGGRVPKRCHMSWAERKRPALGTRW